MKREVIIQILQSKGIPTYGTKSEMVERFRKSLSEQLQIVNCKFYKLSEPKTHAKLCKLLNEVSLC